MIKIRVRFILESKGITNPYNFLVKNGFTPNMATRYINGRVEHLNLSYLEKLCVLLQCTPHDLLEWEPDSGTQVTPTHPLYPLRRLEPPFNIVSHIIKLPMAQVKQVEEFIKQIDQGKENK